MNAVMNLPNAGGLKQELMRFVSAGSTEVTPHDEKLLDDFARAMPANYTVYVAHTPKCSLDDVVRIALRLKLLGFNPSPHIVARRVVDLGHLRDSLSRLVNAGVDQILLIAGDRAAPEGKYASTLELLDSNVTVDAGIRKVGVAGHPEGHPVVGNEVLWEALANKQRFAQSSGTRVHIATQFGFDTRSLAVWEKALAEHGIRLPVHAGVAGPAPLSKLLKYAVHCGVGASLKAVSGNALSLGRLPHLVTKADEMVFGVYRAKQANPDSRIFAPHFFAFGGVLETARWLSAVTRGSFELNAAEGGFSIES